MLIKINNNVLVSVAPKSYGVTLYFPRKPTILTLSDDIKARKRTFIGILWLVILMSQLFYSSIRIGYKRPRMIHIVEDDYRLAQQCCRKRLINKCFEISCLKHLSINFQNCKINPHVHQSIILTNYRILE